MDEDTYRRRMEKRRTTSPKSLMAAVQPLNAAQFEPPKPAIYRGEIMKARCKRLTGRTVVVGNTAFKFDGNGICELKPRGRASELTDFRVLLGMNGVEEVVDPKPWETISPPPAVVTGPTIGADDPTVPVVRRLPPEPVTPDATPQAPIADDEPISDVDSGEKTIKRRRQPTKAPTAEE